MKKPIEPAMPDITDRVKYPLEFNNAKLIDSPFVRDYRRYQKDLEKYKTDIQDYEQLRFMLDIQRSNIKLCLRKYKVTKK